MFPSSHTKGYAPPSQDILFINSLCGTHAIHTRQAAYKPSAKWAMEEQRPALLPFSIVLDISEGFVHAEKQDQ